MFKPLNRLDEINNGDPLFLKKDISSLQRNPTYTHSQRRLKTSNFKIKWGDYIRRRATSALQCTVGRAQQELHHSGLAENR